MKTWEFRGAMVMAHLKRPRAGNVKDFLMGVKLRVNKN